MSETVTIARVTWLVGVIMILVGLFLGRDMMMVVGALILNGGVISLALLTRPRT